LKNDAQGLPIIGGAPEVPGTGPVIQSGSDSDHGKVPVLLRGGPYGEEGKLVSMHPACERRIVHLAEPDDRLTPGQRGRIHEVQFVPTHDKPPPGVTAVWRPTTAGNRIVSN
jgi:hypothetical protein